jgi:hypothetical protein
MSIKMKICFDKNTKSPLPKLAKDAHVLKHKSLEPFWPESSNTTFFFLLPSIQTFTAAFRPWWPQNPRAQTPPDHPGRPSSNLTSQIAPAVVLNSAACFFSLSHCASSPRARTQHALVAASEEAKGGARIPPESAPFPVTWASFAPHAGLRSPIRPLRAAKTCSWRFPSSWSDHYRVKILGWRCFSAR